MGTNCAPLVADLFLLFMRETSCWPGIEAFSSTSRYLEDLLNVDNNFFDSMVNRIYPSEPRLNKDNVSDTEVSFLDLHLSISDGFVETKIHENRDDFDFNIMNFAFLDSDVPRSNPMVFIFLNLFDLLECPVMLMTLILVLTANFSDNDIDIIKFVRRFQNFIGGSLK